LRASAAHATARRTAAGEAVLSGGDLRATIRRLRWLGGSIGNGGSAPLVRGGFDKDSAKELQTRLKPLIRKTQPYSKRVVHHGIWVEPELLAEIEYRAKSAEGKVRHPFFKGLREDL
jgi:ATP dependent DNA ligase C terminal region